VFDTAAAGAIIFDAATALDPHAIGGSDARPLAALVGVAGVTDPRRSRRLRAFPSAQR